MTIRSLLSGIRGGWVVAGLAVACAGSAAAAGERGVSRGKTPVAPVAAATADTVRSENRLIARLLTDEAPDFDQLAESHPEVTGRTLRQIRAAFDKKDREKALLALYGELNEKEIAQAARIWNRSVDKLSVDEGGLRSGLARVILTAFRRFDQDKTPSKGELAAAWRGLMDDYYETPLMIGGIGIERDRLDEALRRNRRKGLESYLDALDRQEVEGRMLRLRGDDSLMATQARTRVTSGDSPGILARSGLTGGSTTVVVPCTGSTKTVGANSSASLTTTTGGKTACPYAKAKNAAKAPAAPSPAVAGEIVN